MDDDYYKAVIKIFVQLYNDGIIYRGLRMVNWDPASKTALSDEEVIFKEIDSKLYYVKYPLVEDSHGPASDCCTLQMGDQRQASTVEKFNHGVEKKA